MNWWMSEKVVCLLFQKIDLSWKRHYASDVTFEKNWIKWRGFNEKFWNLFQKKKWWTSEIVFSSKNCEIVKFVAKLVQSGISILLIFRQNHGNQKKNPFRLISEPNHESPHKTSKHLPNAFPQRPPKNNVPPPKSNNHGLRFPIHKTLLQRKMPRVRRRPRTSDSHSWKPPQTKPPLNWFSNLDFRNFTRKTHPKQKIRPKTRKYRVNMQR